MDDRHNLMQEYQSLFEAVYGYQLLGNLSQLTEEQLKEDIEQLKFLLQ